MKKQIFYVGVFLNERIFFPPYGFTTYADCYTEAENAKEAGKIAKEHFELKHKVPVNGTRPLVANPRFHNPEEIIKPLQTPVQPNIFESNVFISSTD
jgi:hypothetical protein